MKKPGSILRIKQFSESEDDEAEDEMVVDQPEEEAVNEEEAESGEEAECAGVAESAEVAESEEDLNEEEPGPSKSKTSKQKIEKVKKKGIIYISSIPKHMNVAICRELMERFGEVGRIFLQPDSKGMTKKANKKKKNVTFTEGWVEFEKKKVAKWIAQNINTTAISSKKGSKFCDILWSLKYLPGFKWIHLSERLTYERAVQHQKLQVATSKARKEANFFQDNLDKSDKLKKIKKSTQSKDQ